MATNRLIVKEQIATYTSLLFEAVKNEGGSEGVLRLSNEAKQIVAAIRGNADLDAALKDPGFTPEQKATLARNVFADANPALVSVIALMAERDELDYLPRVADGIEERMKDELNIVVVDVTTAVELDDH
ncbi:MAG: F0F1 ATP synthase subunit delta, partial [Eggerthellaceae bacterium]|nr:F0F1 ATP synthase subunit delta [Eggerthellaceae bacterium]